MNYNGYKSLAKRIIEDAATEYAYGTSQAHKDAARFFSTRWASSLFALAEMDHDKRKLIAELDEIRACKKARPVVDSLLEVENDEV